MTYAQARWAGVRIALQPWLRRVCVGMLLALAAASGGGGDPRTLLHALAAAAAWSVMPLHAAGGLAPLLQAGLCALLLRLLQPLLQPVVWLDLERSLPLAPAPLKRTDLLLALLALSPLLLLQAAGLAVLAQPGLLGAWLLGSGLGLAVAVRAMAVRRRPLVVDGPAARAAVAGSGEPRRLSPIWALLVLPLLRGPLRRSALLLVAQGLLLAALPWLLLSPLPATALAMAWVALAWLGLQRSHAMLDSELEGLLAALPPLPLALPIWRRRGRLLALAPLLLALPSLLLALALAGPPMRDGVALALAALLAGFSLWSSLSRWTADDAHAVRLLIGLGLLLALAGELFA